MINLFILKEARHSVSLDNDDSRKYSGLPEMQTRSVGLLNDPDLFNIGIKVMDKETKEVVWRGTVAEANITKSWMR